MGLFAMGGVGIGVMPIMGIIMAKGCGKGKSKSKCKPPPCHNHHHHTQPPFSNSVKFEGKVTYG